MSHELRQPLAAIRANAESGLLLLSRHQIDVEETRQVFREIVIDDIRAAEIIDTMQMLLRTARLKTGTSRSTTPVGGRGRLSVRCHVDRA